MSWLRRLLGWLGAVFGFLLRVAVVGWAALAIRFSNLPWSSLRLGLAIAFAAFGVWALWFARRPRSFLIFAAAFGVVFVWWQTIRPSHDRRWRPDVAVMPRANDRRRSRASDRRAQLRLPQRGRLHAAL